MTLRSLCHNIAPFLAYIMYRGKPPFTFGTGFIQFSMFYLRQGSENHKRLMFQTPQERTLTCWNRFHGTCHKPVRVPVLSELYIELHRSLNTATLLQCVQHDGVSRHAVVKWMATQLASRGRDPLISVNGKGANRHTLKHCSPSWDNKITVTVVLLVRNTNVNISYISNPQSRCQWDSWLWFSSTLKVVSHSLSRQCCRKKSPPPPLPPLY